MNRKNFAPTGGSQQTHNKTVRVAGVSVDNETGISKCRLLSLEFGRCRELVRAAGHRALSPDMSDVTRTAERMLRQAT
jgi:hypothetical protein